MATNPKDKPTNIVFILSDDQGPWAMGCAGNNDIITPNLDRIASKGIRFSNFFCASPVCSPARATILTGQIPSQHGVMDWISKGNMGPESIEYLEGIKGYTDYLAEEGYNCGLSGKWHLGSSAVPQKGFTHWYAHQLGAASYYNAPMIKNGRPIIEEGYVTDRITDDAIEYIEECAKENNPFCININYTAPHVPWTINNHPKEFRDMYKDCKFNSCPQGPYHPEALFRYERKYIRELLTGYFAAVTAMDYNIGRILDTLGELRLTDKTLVVFMSDNGHNCGHHGLWGKGNCTTTLNMYEESIKVPALFSHPGVIPENVVCDEMLSQYDIFPTLLDYMGIEHDADEKLPGKSFVQLLRGEEGYKSNDKICIFDEYGPVRMIRTKEWKYVHRYPRGPHELYNLVEDPGENFNMVGYPDLENVRIQLRNEMNKWFCKYVDPEMDGLREPVTGSGQICKAGIKSKGRIAFHQVRNIQTDPSGQVKAIKAQQEET